MATCTATAKSTGKQCTRPPVPGATVCRFHGGAAPQVQAAAQRRLLLEQATAHVDLWGGRKDVHPAQALLDLVQAKAAEVAYWESRVAQVKAHKDLVWGTTKSTATSDGTVTVEEAVPAIELNMLHTAQKQLAEFAAASLRAGVESAMVELAKAQAATIVAVLRAALSDPRVNVPDDARDLVIVEAIRAHAVTA